jgi:uncharacterized Zn-binding protein involved in type VI secretion
MNGLITESDTVTVQGTVDDNGIDLTINGKSVRVQGRSFSQTVSLAEGLNVISVEATDHFGNTTTEKLQVIRDTQAPQVWLEMPPAGAVLNYFPDILGITEDLTAVQVTVNGAPVSVTSGIFTLEKQTWAAGENVITVVATDAMGHVTSITSSFIFDPLPPELTVETPAADQIFTSQPIEVTGQIKDAYGASVFTNGIPAVIDGEKFTVTAISLAEGENTLTTVAVDYYAMSRSACMLMFDMIGHGGSELNVNIYVPLNLVDRETTKKADSGAAGSPV